ncbi:MAG: hypothetical protein AABY18_01190 [Candidatus Thermoplasmatota archaeon]
MLLIGESDADESKLMKLLGRVPHLGRRDDAARAMGVTRTPGGKDIAEAEAKLWATGEARHQSVKGVVMTRDLDMDYAQHVDDRSIQVGTFPGTRLAAVVETALAKGLGSGGVRVDVVVTPRSDLETTVLAYARGAPPGLGPAGQEDLWRRLVALAWLQQAIVWELQTDGAVVKSSVFYDDKPAPWESDAVSAARTWNDANIRRAADAFAKALGAESKAPAQSFPGLTLVDKRGNHVSRDHLAGALEFLERHREACEGTDGATTGPAAALDRFARSPCGCVWTLVNGHALFRLTAALVGQASRTLEGRVVWGMVESREIQAAAKSDPSFGARLDKLL